MPTRPLCRSTSKTSRVQMVLLSTASDSVLKVSNQSPQNSRAMTSLYVHIFRKNTPGPPSISLTHTRISPLFAIPGIRHRHRRRRQQVHHPPQSSRPCRLRLFRARCPSCSARRAALTTALFPIQSLIWTHFQYVRRSRRSRHQFVRLGVPAVIGCLFRLFPEYRWS